MGVRIFSNGREPAAEGRVGDSLAVQRRTARSARRRRARLLKRKRQLLNALIANDLLPENSDERKQMADLDPYELRVKALDLILPRYELGRAIFHLGVRRGFKSNRKEMVTDEKELSAYNLKILDTKKIIEEKGFRTIGEFLYSKKCNGELLRFRPAEDSLYPSRDMYENEFNLIRKKQSQEYKEVDWNLLYNIIFYQRPLKPQERGKCQFYHQEYRGFKLTPSAQEFRILQEVNNLKYFNEDGEQRSLTNEQKESLEKKLQSVKTLSFNGIRKHFKLPDHCIFNLEQESRKELKGDSISICFKEPAKFGSLWDTLPLEEKDTIIETLILAQSDEEVMLFLDSYNLREDQKLAICKLSLSSDTTSLSNKFMRECIVFMRNDYITYDQACDKMGFHHSYKKQEILLEVLPYYGYVLNQSTIGADPAASDDFPEVKYGKIGNPTVHIALNQLRKLVNCLIKRFGTAPTEIVIELSRDLKTSREEKRKILEEQTKNKKNNDRIFLELKENFKLLNPNSWDIKKYRLWEELGKDRISRNCVYCGKPIAAHELFTNAIEIEHILPYSRTLLSSMNNLTVAHRSCNAIKKQQTPYEAFGSNPGGFNWKDIVERTRNLPKTKRDFILLRSLKDFQKGVSFEERQLQDNRYLSRVTSEYLSVICKASNIWVTPGKQTSILRARWGLNTILNNNHDTWFKNRYDHRHHAIDAFVISMTDRSLIKKMADLNQSSSPYDIQVPLLPFSYGTILEHVKNIIPSLKIDHGVEGKLFKETAASRRERIEEIQLDDLKENDIANIESPIIKNLFLSSDKKFKAKKELVREFLKNDDGEIKIGIRRTYWVSRKPIDQLTSNDLKKNRVFDIRLSIILKNAAGAITEQKQLKEKLQELSKQLGVSNVRYIPDNQIFIPIKSSPHKGYENAEFFAVIIWKVPEKKNSKYVGTFISRAEAYAFAGGSSLNEIKPHSGAKKMMTLYKDDTVLIRPQDTSIVPYYARIVGFSTTQNKLDIRPVYASEDALSWLENTNNKLCDEMWESRKGQNFKSINVLLQANTIIPIKVLEDGRVN